MNQLDLILENIRLKHIETLLTEATTDLEVVRGQRLINESIMQLRGALIQEVSTGKLLAGGALLGAGLEAGIMDDHPLSQEQNDKIINKAIGDNYDKFINAHSNNLNSFLNDTESMPNFKDHLIAERGTDYMNGINDDLKSSMIANPKLREASLAGANFGNKLVNNTIQAADGAVLGAGAVGLGLGARRLIRR